MRYQVMASFRGLAFEAALGPADEDVVLFSVAPPPEGLQFEQAGGLWRLPVRRSDLDALWESRPVGRYRGHPCLVLDDLGDRMHIAFQGHDAYEAEQLGYWQVDRGVYEVVVPRHDVTDLADLREDHPLRRAEPAALSGSMGTTPPGPGTPPPGMMATAPGPMPGETLGSAGSGYAALPAPATAAGFGLMPAEAPESSPPGPVDPEASFPAAPAPMGAPGGPVPPDSLASLATQPVRPMNAEPAGANGSGTQHAAPQPGGPQYGTPRSTGQHALPQDTGSGNAGPQHALPQGTGPQYAGTQYPGTQYPGPQHSGSQYPGPQYSGPQYPGPQHAGSQDPGPQYSGPQYSGPQYSGPQHPGAQYTAGQYTGEQYPAGQYPAPQEAGAQDVPSPDAGSLDPPSPGAPSPDAASPGAPSPAARMPEPQTPDPQTPDPHAAEPAGTGQARPAAERAEGGTTATETGSVDATTGAPAASGGHQPAPSQQSAPDPAVASGDPTVAAPSPRSRRRAPSLPADMMAAAPPREPAANGRGGWRPWSPGEQGSDGSGPASSEADGTNGWAGPDAAAESPEPSRQNGTHSAFRDLVGLAAIPDRSFAVDEDVEGARCLVRTDDGFEVYSSAGNEKHEVRFFLDEESAYFYLFGVLAADALRNGRLVRRES